MADEGALSDTSDPEAEAAADARAESDAREGRVISHAAVSRWLQSRADGKPLPRPHVGD